MYKGFEQLKHYVIQGMVKLGNLSLEKGLAAFR
jgi:hypothetical protein